VFACVDVAAGAVVVSDFEAALVQGCACVLAWPVLHTGTELRTAALAVTAAKHMNATTATAPPLASRDLICFRL